MSGKVVGIFILLSSLCAGAALYYLQVYGFYRQVAHAEVMLTLASGGQAEPLAFTDFQAIDADSSPIRYRACFRTPETLADLQGKYQPYEKAVPRNAPPWFDCFDAAAIAQALKAGEALSFLGQKNIGIGVDRVVAITQDGHGYVWHQLNECGQKAYDGTIVGEECPKQDTN